MSQIFVATNVLLREKFICRDKHTFVATREVFCRYKHVFVATKLILVAATTNDTQEPFVSLETCWMNATFTASNRDEGI